MWDNRLYWFGLGRCKSCSDQDLLFLQTNRWVWNSNLCLRSNQFEPTFFTFQKRNERYPCTLGGTLSIGKDELVVNVHPNLDSKFVQGKNGCACIFPPEAVDYSQGPTNQVPVYVEFDCNDGPPDTTDILVDLPVGAIQEICERYGCDSCEVVSNGCFADLRCVDYGDIIYENIHELWADDEQDCYVIFHTEFNEFEQRRRHVIVGTPCSVDPCNADRFEYEEYNIFYDIDDAEFAQLSSRYQACQTTEICNFNDGSWPKSLFGNVNLQSRNKHHKLTKKSTFFLYPNPINISRSSVISYESTRLIYNCEIISAAGNVTNVKVVNNQLILDNSLKSGVYFVKAYTVSGEMLASKIVVQ